MKKIIGILFVIGIIILLFFFGKLGLGFGAGMPFKSKNSNTDRKVKTISDSEQSSSITDVLQEKSDEVSEEESEVQELIIRMEQDKYFINDEVIGLIDIEKLLKEDKPEYVVIENNFGAVKTENDLKELLEKYHVSYREQ